MKRGIRYVGASLAFFCLVPTLFAADRYWVGRGDDWSDPAYWSTTSGGQGGASVPTITDDVFFDGNSNDCAIHAVASVNNLTVDRRFVGELLARNKLNVFGGFKMDGGKVTLDSASLDVHGDFTVTAGQFRAPIDLLLLGGIHVAQGTFRHNHGLILISGNSDQKITAFEADIYRLEVRANNPRKLDLGGNTLRVTLQMQLTGTAPLQIINGGINFSGDSISIKNTGQGGGGNARIVLDGSKDQKIIGASNRLEGTLPNVVINKPSGNAVLENKITINGDFRFIRRFGVGFDGTTSHVFFVDNQGISAKIISAPTAVFNDVTILTGTRLLASSLTILGDLTITSHAALNLSAFSLNLLGHWTHNGPLFAGTATVTFSGKGTQKFTSTIGQETFYNISINKPSGGVETPLDYKVMFDEDIAVANRLSLTNGYIELFPDKRLVIENGADIINGSENSFIDGIIEKRGINFPSPNEFVFRVGSLRLPSGSYHPLTIFSNSSFVTTDWYTAHYIPKTTTLPTDASQFENNEMEAISTCEHWVMQRSTNGTPFNVTLGLHNNSCFPERLPNLIITGWNGEWRDLGKGNQTFRSNGSESVQSFDEITETEFAPTVMGVSQDLTLTFALKRPKGYAVLHRKSTTRSFGYHQVPSDDIYCFCYEEEYNDTDGILSYSIYDKTRQPLTVPNLSVKYGDNRYCINMAGIHGTANGDRLTIEITNEKNEVWVGNIEH